MVARVLDTHAVLHVCTFQIPSPLAGVGNSLPRPQLSPHTLRTVVTHPLGYINPPDVAHERYPTCTHELIWFFHDLRLFKGTVKLIHN